MVKNRKLSRAISDLGWRSFRDMLSAKSDKYGHNFRIISRWEPTSQRCSCCGNIGGKKALNIREWECFFCGTFHDRDVNAAINIKVAGGQSETLNGRVGKRKTSVKEAASCEALRDLRGNNIPIDRRAQALRPYSNGFCPQCRGELRSPKRYIIKAQVPNPIDATILKRWRGEESPSVYGGEDVKFFPF
jgi:hypothetical protein